MARSGSYGVDAPGVLIGLASSGVAFIVVAGIWAREDRSWSLAGPILAAIVLLASTALFAHATLRGKFLVWSDLLDRLGLRGDEALLDLGCGRGAVLIAAAKRLPAGRAVGVDLWRSVDQSGNALAVTQRNAEAEGVANRVELHTANLTALPFADGEFDVVVSSLAIHNIKSLDGRHRAIDEAVRVLRPGGRLVIADIQKAAEYEARLRELGWTDVSLRGLGWQFWYGGPWMAASAVTGQRPQTD